jgi:two-component system response regulator PilR (NtrC family)
MNKRHILIIDDEPDIRELLEITIGRMGLETTSAHDLSSALSALKNQQFHLCLTDMKLPDGEGLEIIQYIQAHCPQTPVAMITAFGSMEVAINALKAGAFDYLTKPVDLDRLRQLIESALSLENNTEQIQFDHQVQLLGSAPGIERLRLTIAKLARSQTPVFISGESGSGKEVVARLIHSNGPRGSAPFVPVNCGAIPTELMESEFFGHTKGSFTGAIGDKKGLFEAANNGTLFLDEVADLPLPMQVKLLRAIQEKTIRRIGSNEEISINTRIVSATHKNLSEEIEKGHFRSDLFYRINVIEVQVPALRERKEDIGLLTHFIVEKLANEWQIEKPVITPEALTALNQYAFPGNVRELENIIERAYTLCEGERIQASDLQLSNSEPALRTGDGVLYHNSDPEQAFGSLEEYLETLESKAIKLALERTRWNKTAAAKLLGISFRQLRYRLSKLDMDDDTE